MERYLENVEKDIYHFYQFFLNQNTALNRFLQINNSQNGP